MKNNKTNEILIKVFESCGCYSGVWSIDCLINSTHGTFLEIREILRGGGCASIEVQKDSGLREFKIKSLEELENILAIVEYFIS